MIPYILLDQYLNPNLYTIPNMQNMRFFCCSVYIERLLNINSGLILIVLVIFVPRLFEEKRRDIVFGIPSVLPSVLPSFRPPNIVGTLCAQLLLQFYADSFETLQMF